MAQQTYELICDSIAYISQSNPNSNTQVTQGELFTLETVNERLYYHFPNFPDALKYKKLIRGYISIYASDISKPTISVYTPTATYNPLTITWNTRTGGDNGQNFVITTFGASIWSDKSGTAYEISERTKAWLKYNGVYIRRADTSTAHVRVYNEYSSSRPYVIFTVYYDDGADLTSQIKSTSKTSGYINPRDVQTFTWDYVGDSADGTCFGDFTQANAVFYWREGTSGSYTSVNVSGNTKQISIPANTFPVGSNIQYYISGTDTVGTTTQTSVYTLSTTAGTASATPVSPKNSAEDGTNEITFRWTLSSTDGQTPSRVVGYWKLYQNTSDPWTPMFDVSSPITSYTVPGGTISAGDIAWEIAAYNIDGVMGAYQQARFICINAPNPVEGLSATSVPFSTISWQSSSQQAYQISIDGVIVKKAFGSDVYNYTLDDPLEDGTHTISVSVQGIYGYWSQPSTITINVNNTTSDELQISGNFDGYDAALSWTGTTGKTFIYRDGKKVGATENAEFIDRYALGWHSWYVVEQLDNGNYNISDTINGTIKVDNLIVSEIAGGDWLPLKLSEKSTTEQTFSFSKQYSTIHVSGAVYPVMELGVYEDIVGGYDCAFSNYDDAKRFEELRGKPIIIKSRGNNVMFGVITQMQSHYGDFVTGYTFGITRIHVEDFVNDTAG